MSNLLPKKEKKSLKTEYSLRRFSVALFLICVILIMSLTLLFPSYILSRVRATNVSLDLENVKKATNVESTGDDFAVRLKDAKDKALALRISEKNLSVYDLIRSFESKSKAIRLKEISYSRSAEEITIAIQGNAGDRESLTQFEKQQKSNTNFSSVNLPISNFAKEKNIDFSMNITVKK